MKVLKLIVAGFILFLTNAANAQVSVNVNIGTPPLWGPVGYTEVRYYYLPDVEAYYDVQTSMFIYYGGGVWLHRTYLPSRYRNYDLYNGYKVVIVDYHGDNPNVYYNTHKIKYAKGYRGSPQKTIGSHPGKGNYKSNEHNKNFNGQKQYNNQGRNDSKMNHQKSSGSKGNSNSGGHKGGKGKNK